MTVFCDFRASLIECRTNRTLVNSDPSQFRPLPLAISISDLIKTRSALAKVQMKIRSELAKIEMKIRYELANVKMKIRSELANVQTELRSELTMVEITFSSHKIVNYYYHYYY